MKNITTLNFDFVVVGGGLTGLCAAIAAARGGAKTALIHEDLCLAVMLQVKSECIYVELIQT